MNVAVSQSSLDNQSLDLISRCGFKDRFSEAPRPLIKTGSFARELIVHSNYIIH